MRAEFASRLLPLALLAATPVFATDGYFSIGYGLKQVAQGGAGVALPQDALAAATNPAGIVFVGDRFDLGVTLFRPIRDGSITGSGAITRRQVKLSVPLELYEPQRVRAEVILMRS